MTENEAIREIETSLELAEMCTPNRERYREITAYKMAIQALEEIQQYRAMEQRLQNIYGECDGLLETVVQHLENHENIKLPDNIIKARLLTDEDVDKWEGYQAIGTVEEIQSKLEAYRELGTMEELKALKEKNTPKKPFGGMYNWTCPTCGTYHSTHGKCCSECMQMILWD